MPFRWLYVDSCFKLFDFILRVFMLLAGYFPAAFLGCLSTAVSVSLVYSMPRPCSWAALSSGTWVDCGVSTGEGCRGGRARVSLCVSTPSTCRNNCVDVMVSTSKLRSLCCCHQVAPVPELYSPTPCCQTHSSLLLFQLLATAPRANEEPLSFTGSLEGAFLLSQ